MKILKTISFLLLSLFFMHLNAQELAVFDTEAFSIKYPKDWTFDTSGQMNTTFLIFSKLEENDTFSDNVNLMIQDLTNMNLDLKGYTELSIKQVKEIPNSEIFESEDLKKDTLDYHQIVWKGFVSGKNLKFKQLYYIKDTKAYLLTLTCEVEKYDDYVVTGTKILNSFTLK